MLFWWIFGVLVLAVLIGPKNLLGLVLTSLSLAFAGVLALPVPFAIAFLVVPVVAFLCQSLHAMVIGYVIYYLIAGIVGHNWARFGKH